MDAKKKQELLNSLKSEFDDYLDYYDLMECIPDISEGKLLSLKQRRCSNGLSKFSYYTNKDGVLLVSFAKFRKWHQNNFRPLREEDLQ